MNSAEGQTGDTQVTPFNPAAALPVRLQFWLDTCRDVGHMHSGARQIIELYRQYGCRFFEPGLEQVQNVVTALDAAMPLWEKEHPELFYQTLELNYPELVRRAC
jgi:hypothetical protein